MDADLYQKVMTEGGCADLSDRAKWRLRGGDRVRYLNGQVTNDVRRTAPDAALYACVTNVKGKIEGDIFVHSDQESLLLDAEPGLLEALGIRLERYIIADDAQLEDVTDAWRLWHVFGPAADRLPAASGSGRTTVRSLRFGIPGVDLWQPAGSEPPAISAPLLPADALESFRILQRVPRHPNELNSDTFPQEAALEARAMSFTKGCYIGQEILSRIKTTGKMPRQLISWEAAEGEITTGDALFLPSVEGGAKAVGTITSITRHPLRQKQVGLGFLKPGVATSDSRLLVGSDVPRIGTSVYFSPVTNQ